jgi:protein-S-isoprenylcysteine O-methyltransferase Ste14
MAIGGWDAAAECERPPNTPLGRVNRLATAGSNGTMYNRLELKVPPVALLLVTAALMWGVARAASGLGFRLPMREFIGTGFALAGLVVSAVGVAAFKRAQTTVNPMQPGAASSLVVSGIYRRTRNPMYLGFALVLLGWAAFLSNALAGVLLPTFVLYMNRFQIWPEERALKARFGQAFVDYTSQVRRWL